MKPKDKPMLLNYQPADAAPFRAQKVAAILTGVCGACMAIGVRMYADAHPGDNLLALGVLAMGWVFVILGACWYLACRKTEG